MDPMRPQLTVEVQTTILSYLRSGAFLRVAVEAAAVPWAEYRRLMRLGRQDGPDSPHHAFRRSVVQARAQGRLRAETEVFQKSPMLWLKHGPGREQPGYSGWASAARATAASASGKYDKPLESPAMQAMLQQFIDAVEDSPEHRRRLAAITQNKVWSEPEA